MLQPLPDENVAPDEDSQPLRQYDSELERVSFDGEIWGGNNSGAIVGNLVRTEINDCAAIGNVTGRVNIGGIGGTWTTVHRFWLLRSRLRR